jgi:hypothetical protein
VTLALGGKRTTIESGDLDRSHLIQEVSMMTVTHESYIRRDEEILKNTFRALIVRAGVMMGWLLLIIAICFSVLLLR